MSKNPIQYFIIIILFAIITSCKNESSTNKTLVPRSPEIIDTTAECQQAKTRYQNEKDEELKVIDFFGVKMQGKYKDIVNNIYELPMLSLLELRDPIADENSDLMYVFHGVEFCGVPCGMNIRFRKYQQDEISIHSIIFITSETDDEIIHKFVSELTKYYGTPDISDEKEDSYHWYLPSGLAVRARHLHAPDGGWTVFFHY